jgi:hypothetical protein
VAVDAMSLYGINLHQLGFASQVSQSFHANVRVLISKDSLGDELNRVISLIKTSD